MSQAFLNGAAVRLDPKKVIGKGGEADIYDIGGGRALKLFKTPDHPDLFGNAIAQADAKARIAEHQRKLRAFPGQVPHQVIAPETLATDRTGRTIVGYTMPLVDNSTPLRFYWPAREELMAILLDLHAAVADLHKQNVVVGDFTALNVMGKGRNAFLIDADSMQFAGFFCKTFTEYYVDPTHCDPKAKRPVLTRPHTPNSDWFSYAVIVMETLLKVTPYYGGVYKGPVPQYTRPLQRITIFDPKVIYPKQAVHFNTLPDELLHHFALVFEKDRREAFPTDLIVNMRWQTCDCGVTHARRVCPDCGSKVGPVPVPPTVVTRGALRAVTLFVTRGHIRHVATQDGEPLIAYVEGGHLHSLALNRGEKHDLGAIAKGARVRFAAGKPVIVTATSADFRGQIEQIDSYRGKGQFEGTAKAAFWTNNGALWKTTAAGPRSIAATLRHQTRIWVGDKLGFAFYQAGALSDGFLFRTDTHGLVDGIDISQRNAQILEMNAVFSGATCAWVFMQLKEGARIFTRLIVLGADGKEICRDEADADSGHWLDGFRGVCANSNSVFAPTNSGVTRVTLKDGVLSAPAVFQQTEDFVSADSYLFLSPRGLLVAGAKKLIELQIN